MPYIDSAGLGEIVRTYTTVSRQGGKLKLLNLTKRIQDLLAITKLLTVFETYESEPDAIKSFRQVGTRTASHATNPRMAQSTLPRFDERADPRMNRFQVRAGRWPSVSYCPCVPRSGRRT